MKPKFNSTKYIPFVILILVLMMSIGYAVINSVTFDIKGESKAKTQQGVFITSVSEETSSGIETYNTNMAYQTVLDSNVVLDNDLSSKKIINVSFYNNSDFSYKFVGIDYLDDETISYSNENIIFSYNKEGYILEPGKYVTITVTFKFKEDANIQSNSLESILNFKFHYIESILNGSIPIFDDVGMIPVTIDNEGTATTADLSDDWYSYEEKRWANAILVSKENRSKYLNEENVKVASDDIISYYVWIPRYSYKIWTTNASVNTNPQTINIKFENIDTISLGDSVGEYLTMPAFWWDKDNDKIRESGEEISGIWVGKFETSKGTSNNVGSDYPVILPNKSSWVSQTISQQFSTILKINNGKLNNSTGNVTFDGSSIYGLSETTNVHLLKNSEWAAMTYLSHSTYGVVNKEIRINNYYKNSNFMTGCGASTDNASASTTCDIQYGTSDNYPQSSTGNISGVFDMSGGAWDRVMGNYNNQKGSSGFSAFPEKKYYDMFSLSSLSACTVSICGGQALYETSEWYNDLSNFINNNSYPWIVRSGGYSDAETAGMFNFGKNVGQSTQLSTMRAALIVFP